MMDFFKGISSAKGLLSGSMLKFHAGNLMKFAALERVGVVRWNFSWYVWASMFKFLRGAPDVLQNITWYVPMVKKESMLFK